jgi:hypothetical protein
MLKPNKPTIFDLLDRIQAKDSSYYKALPPEQKQTLAPYLAMRWLATSPDDDQVLLLNDVANRLVFGLGHNHPELMFDVLTACTSGRKSRYKWVKRPTSNKPLEAALQQYFGSHVDVSDMATTLTPTEVTEICQQLGYQDQEIALLLKKAK